MNLLQSPFPWKQSTKILENILLGKVGAFFVAKFGAKIWKIWTTFALQLSWLYLMWPLKHLRFCKHDCEMWIARAQKPCWGLESITRKYHPHTNDYKWIYRDIFSLSLSYKKGKSIPPDFLSHFLSWWSCSCCVCTSHNSRAHLRKNKSNLRVFFFFFAFVFVIQQIGGGAESMAIEILWQCSWRSSDDLSDPFCHENPTFSCMVPSSCSELFLRMFVWTFAIPSPFLFLNRENVQNPGIFIFFFRLWLFLWGW